nr:hypothetical protein [Tanacetum cinerariifolium]
MGTMWYLYDLTPSGKGHACIYFNFSFVIKLAIGLNVFLQVPGPPGESLSKAWTRFKDLLQKVPHHANGKLRDKNNKESWALLEDLALYDNECLNDPMGFAKPIKAISLPQDVLSISDCRLIELENQVQCLIEAYLAPKSPIQVNKIAYSCKICSGPHNTQYCMENPEQAFVDYASSRIDKAGGKKAKIVVGEGITSTNEIGARTPYYTKKDIMDYHLPEEWQIARDSKLNPFKDVLIFRKMVEFIGTMPINLKGNMLDSEEFMEEMMDCNKPPKEGDGAWHIRIELIDPDGENFNRTFQSIPTTRKLFEK